MRKGIPQKLRVYGSHRTQPEMNGQDVATEMRRLRPQAPIIMLTGAVEVPNQVLQCVDAFIARDHLASQLLPAIAQFSSEGPLSLIDQIG